ncbi:MAG: hypothetical protein IPN79_12440 [Saprospiraceae bacterium]|nr:hypothetical protein [Saprospiraceae bacterium]
MSPFIDQIHDYVANRLPENERLAFEEACKNQPDLQKMVDHYSTLKSIGLAVIDEEVRSIAKEVANPPKPKTTYRLLFWILLSVLLLSGIYFVVKSQTKKPLQYVVLYMDPSWPISRSADSDTLSDAINIGLDGNIQAAKNMIFATSLSTFEKNLWVAELFAKNKMADSTLIYLPQNPETNIQRDRINYLRILSLYHVGKTTEMKELIDLLPEDTDPVYLKIYDQLK